MMENELRIEEYFLGESYAWGAFFSRRGKMIKQFTVDMIGKKKGNTLTLEEVFHYDDTTTSKRTWTLVKEDDKSYSGTAQDVIGTAEGKIEKGNFHWKYVLRLPVGGRTWDLTFDDIMYPLSEGIVLNRATAYKWGFKVGEVVLFFSKENVSSTEHSNHFSKQSTSKEKKSIPSSA